MTSLRRLSAILDDGATLSGLNRMPTFLNVRSERYALNMIVIRELGIIARIALIFSRRGLDIATFNLHDSNSVGISEVSLEFEGNEEQLRAVTHDLRKLVDVYSVDTSVIRSVSNRHGKFTSSTKASYSTSVREQL